MKLSTYLMIGAFAAGLAACVGVTLWFNNTFFREATPEELLEIKAQRGEVVEVIEAEWDSLPQGEGSF